VNQFPSYFLLLGPLLVTAVTKCSPGIELMSNSIKGIKEELGIGRQNSQTTV
jgi:hypothetical protein